MSRDGCVSLFRKLRRRCSSAGNGLRPKSGDEEPPFCGGACGSLARPTGSIQERYARAAPDRTHPATAGCPLSHRTLETIEGFKLSVQSGMLPQPNAASSLFAVRIAFWQARKIPLRCAVPTPNLRLQQPAGLSAPPIRPKSHRKERHRACRWMPAQATESRPSRPSRKS